MIEQYSFLDMEELTEQRGGIKRSFQNHERKKSRGGGVLRELQMESEYGEEAEEHWKIKMTLVVPLEGRTE